MPADHDVPMPSPRRHLGVLSRQDVEAREQLARRRPRWRARPRQPLSRAPGAFVVAAVGIPLVMAITGVRIVARLEGDGWHRLLGLALLAFTGGIVWCEVLYLRRPRLPR